MSHPRASSFRTRNRIYAAGLAAMVAFFASAPLLMKAKMSAQSSGNTNLTTQPAPLSGSQIMRGAYLNSGSRDAGVDPSWKGGRFAGGSSFAEQVSKEDLVAARARLDAKWASEKSA